MYHLTGWSCDVSYCLFTWWFDSSFFVIAIWDGEPVDSNSHRLPAFFSKEMTSIDTHEVAKQDRVYVEISTTLEDEYGFGELKTHARLFTDDTFSKEMTSIDDTHEIALKVLTYPLCWTKTCDTQLIDSPLF